MMIWCVKFDDTFFVWQGEERPEKVDVAKMLNLRNTQAHY